MRRLAWLALSLALPLAGAPLDAETAVLLEDIQPGNPAVASLAPKDLTPVGDKLFFLSEALDLWVTDGTAPGTQALAALCHPLCDGFAEEILGHNGRLLFFSVGEDRNDQDSEDREESQRLWRSDGTRPGTFPLGFPELALRSSPGPDPIAAVAGRRLFFEGCTAAGCELWVSDGSEAGTRLVQEGQLWALAAAGPRVFAVIDRELWISDGTAAGTVELARLSRFRGFDGSLTVAGGRAIFFAEDERGLELWTSDGTPAGTRPLTTFAPANPLTHNPWLTSVGGRAYFVADDGTNGQELWRSDGTAAGTRRTTAAPHRQAFEFLGPSQLAEVQGRLVFPLWEPGLPSRLWTVPAAVNAAAPAPLCGTAGCLGISDISALVPLGGRLLLIGDDLTLWSTDGTPRGTVPLGGSCPAPCAVIRNPVSLLGAAYFVAYRDAGRNRGELWATDGTPAGTRRVVEPELGITGSLEIAALGQRLFFAAHDEVTGTELWTLDRRRARPRRVADLGRGSQGSLPHTFTPVGGRLLFNACDEAGLQVFASAGDGATTAPLFTIPRNPGTCHSFNSPTLTSAGALAYFWADLPGNGGAELWRTDGTPAGTLPLALWPTGRSDLAALPGGVVVFRSFVQATDRFELWASDGTAPGTRKIVDLPGSTGPLTALGGEAFFAMEQRVDGVFTGTQVWRTDGTPQGTRVEAAGGFESEHLPFVRLGSDVLFFASSGGMTQLWKLGPAGAAPVSPLGFTAPNVPLVHLGVLYFLADPAPPGNARRALWRSDGTEAGTRQVAELPRSSYPEELAAVGGFLLFHRHDDEHGAELWVSDGTPAGTGLLLDIAPGPASAFPFDLTPAGHRLFFSAYERGHGEELWQTDGTPAGTRRVQDLHPGLGSSSPHELAVVGDRLYFAATDGETGIEPWYLPLLPAGSAPCQPSAERLCLAGGRFQVDVAWRDFGGRAGAGRAVPLTNDTGAFWFFDAKNLELVVKVLDGNGLNGHFWVFYGALSNVDYTLTVTDTRTGAARRYVNSAGNLASVGDTQAFGPLGASAQAPLSLAPAAAPALAALTAVSERLDPAAAVPCQPGPRRLCLNGGRFAVTATWKDFQDRTGEGTALPLTGDAGDTGAFWFFDASNLEVLLKVIDGRGLNGRFWVFYGALSNVEYELTVTDSEIGMVKTYRNPRGRFASAADTAAF